MSETNEEMKDRLVAMDLSLARMSDKVRQHVATIDNHVGTIQGLEEEKLQLRKRQDELDNTMRNLNSLLGKPQEMDFVEAAKEYTKEIANHVRERERLKTFLSERNIQIKIPATDIIDYTISLERKSDGLAAELREVKDELERCKARIKE